MTSEPVTSPHFPKGVVTSSIPTFGHSRVAAVQVVGRDTEVWAYRIIWEGLTPEETAMAHTLLDAEYERNRENVGTILGLDRVRGRVGEPAKS